MMRLAWWMRIVGAFYLLLCVLATIVRLPIKVVGPEGALARASAGDPTARFLVDTWVTYGLELGVIGTALLIASREPAKARVFIWTVLAIELVRGIGTDIYMIARGYELPAQVIWIAIHSVIIGTGVLFLRKTS